MKAKVYDAWSSLKNRCNNPNNKSYRNYGGRGITVDPVYYDFNVFYADVGDPPTPKHSIDRIDNDGNYEPGNLRWATHLEQCGNRRKTYNPPKPKIRRGMRRLYTIGKETKSFAKWCKIYKVHTYQFIARILKGIDPLTALNTVSRTNKTGYVGVCFDKRTNSYRARINTKNINWDKRGFKTAEEAHAAYLERKVV
jgi:hypothetical protein